jgi:hypothetical protein
MDGGAEELICRASGIFVDTHAEADIDLENPSPSCPSKECYNPQLNCDGRFGPPMPRFSQSLDQGKVCARIYKRHRAFTNESVNRATSWPLRVCMFSRI